MAFDPDPSHQRYHELVRALARRDEVKAAELERALSDSGRSWEDLERDLALARERRRLLKESNDVFELELRCAIAAEGYRMIREAADQARADAAADQARADAAAKEAKARAAFRQLQGRLRGARRAEQQLAELLPPHLVQRLEDRRKQLADCRAQIERARRNGKSAEHLEAALEQAELAWKTTRKAIG